MTKPTQHKTTERNRVDPETRVAVWIGRRMGLKLREIAADLRLPLGTAGTIIAKGETDAR
jgi:hypothetical protein